MTILFHDRSATGKFQWRERVFDLAAIFLIRLCPKSFKVEINYKDKPKEDLRCTEAEVKQIHDQISHE